MWPGSAGPAPYRPRPEDPQVGSRPTPLAQLSSQAPPRGLRLRRGEPSPTPPLTGSAGLAGPAEWGVQPVGPPAPGPCWPPSLAPRQAGGAGEAARPRLCAEDEDMLLALFWDCLPLGQPGGPRPGRLASWWISFQGTSLADPFPGAPAWRTSTRGTRLVGLLLEAHTARGPSLLCGPQVEPGPSLPTPHPSSLPSPRSDSSRQPRVQAVGPERGSLDISCPLGACPGLSVHGCPGGALGQGVGAGEARGLGSWDRKALLGGAGLRVRKERPAGGWSERVPGEPPAGWGFSREPTLGGTIRLWRRDGGVRSQQGWARLGGPATHPSPRTQGQLLEPQTTPGTPQLLFAWGGVWAPAGGDQRGSAPF